MLQRDRSLQSCGWRFLPAFIHYVDLLAVPVAIPLLADVCQAARWAPLGAQSTLAETWRDFDPELNSNEAAFASHRA